MKEGKDSVVEKIPQGKRKRKEGKGDGKKKEKEKGKKKRERRRNLAAVSKGARPLAASASSLAAATMRLERAGDDKERKVCSTRFQADEKMQKKIRQWIF